MALPQNVLSEIQKNIQTAEIQLKELEPEILRAQRAGVDVSTELASAKELRDSIRKLKTAYV